ncbi:MAG: hypothetical protein O3B65_04120 [Chloroflexi bacterium]|nr:hypothetical protein [Chloroflexota bacterium]
MKTLGLLIAVVVLSLVGCGAGMDVVPTPTPTLAPTATPTPRLPLPEGGNPTGAPAHLWRELGNGVIATTDDYLGRRAVYVTHVPTGGQVVLDGDGVEQERHESKGMQAIEAALAGDGVRAGLATMLEVPVRARGDCAVLYSGGLHFGGVSYIEASWIGGDTELSQGLVGDVVYRVAFRTDCTQGLGMGYQDQDGDATFLNPGTPIYAVRGYASSFRLAADLYGSMRVYEAALNPAAAVGEDLLDIRGKVASIDVLSEPSSGIVVSPDGEQKLDSLLATIDDTSQVAEIVSLLLSSPVNQGIVSSKGERLYLAFRLADGTSVVRSFWLGSGTLWRGIMTPPRIAELVKAAVG